MTSIFTNKEFQSYYQDLINHPEKIDDPKSKIIETMKNQFKELQGSPSEKIVNPFSRSFWEARKGLKNFEKFTTLFVKTHHLNESDALEINQAMNKINYQFRGGFGGALFDRLQRIETNLMATLEVDNVVGNDTKANVKNNLNTLIKDQRNQLAKENESFQKMSKRYSVARKIFNVGIPALGVATIVGLPFAIPVGVITLGAVLGIVLLVSIVSRGYVQIFGVEALNKKIELINDNITKIDHYSRLKNLTDHPTFNEFVLDEDIRKKLEDPKTTLEVMDLFERKIKNEEEIVKL